MDDRKLKYLTIPQPSRSPASATRARSRLTRPPHGRGVSRNTIYKLCKQGMLGRRVNRIYYIGQHELAQLFLSEADRERIGRFRRTAQNGR